VKHVDQLARSAPPGAWTPHADLNEVLARWIGQLQAELGANLVGAYLHGSLAVGDADEASDVDFLVAVNEDIPRAGIERLHALHRTLCALPSPWARNFEGSYAPIAALRRLSTEPRDAPGEPRPDGRREPGTWRPGPYAYPFWFVSEDDAPVRREYDNCQLVRWVLREKGVRLVGPPATTLIDPVGAAALRREMAEMLACNRERLSGDLSWFRTAYGQASGVLAFARALETIETGEVRSKRSALAFAAQRLEPRWAALVRAAFATRAEHAADASMNRPAEPQAVAETLAFLDWAAEHTARHR
jgi:predicted nucleotidyltransferase